MLTHRVGVNTQYAALCFATSLCSRLLQPRKSPSFYLSTLYIYIPFFAFVQKQQPSESSREFNGRTIVFAPRETRLWGAIRNRQTDSLMFRVAEGGEGIKRRKQDRKFRNIC